MDQSPSGAPLGGPPGSSPPAEASGARQGAFLEALRRLVESPATRLVAVCILLGLVAVAVDSSAMREAARSARWGLVVPAVALVPIQVLSGALLWLWLARSIDPRLSLGEALRASLGSLSVSIWTPGRAGDFAARPMLMPRGSRKTLAVAVGAESLLRLPVPLLLAVPAALAIPFPGHRIFAGLCALTALAAVVLFSVRGVARRLAIRLRIDHHVSFLRELSHPARLALVLGHGARYVLLVLQFSLVALAMGGAAVSAASVGAACVVILAAKLVAPLLSFAELGIREGASVVALGAIGFTPEAALQASLLLYAINVLIPAAIGAFFWLRRSRS